MTDTVQDFPARLVYQPVLGLIEQMASKSPAPGGGSAAALSGALGSALLTMVINLTVEKKNYADVAPRLSELKVQTEELRAKLTANVDADTAAFNRYRVANKLPERNDEEKAAKEIELKAATWESINVPLSTMECCLKGLHIAPEVAEKGNSNCVSDAGTGAELLLAGLEGAAANVLINLPGLPAEDAPALRARVDEARRTGRAQLDRARQIVNGKLSG